MFPFAAPAIINPLVGIAAPTFSPTDQSTGFTLSNNNRTATANVQGVKGVRGLISKSSGRFALGFSITAGNTRNGAHFCGAKTSADSLTDVSSAAGYQDNGYVFYYGATYSGLPTYGAGDFIVVDYDFVNGNINFYKNGGLVTTITATIISGLLPYYYNYFNGNAATLSNAFTLPPGSNYWA